ncbi:MAG TPA: S8 family serine peptidase, partial [Phototrophicaceae bacterium]|nr:S8 family serine peptidase [Phototrophicaceae bacterium]
MIRAKGKSAGLFRLWILIIPFILLSFGIFPSLSSAQPEQPISPAPFLKLPPDLSTGTTDVNQLLTIARSRGTVSVIVGLQTAAIRGLPDPDLAREISRSQQAFLTTLAGQNFTVVRQFKFIPYLALRVDVAALQTLQRSPLVTSITLNRLISANLAESAPQVGAAGAGGAWSMGFEGTGQTVAIIDSGVDKTHSALTGRIVSEACYSNNFNPGDIPAGSTSQSACPGGVASSTAPGSGVNCPAAYLGCDHGTHVAGIAASAHATYRGMAPQANIIAIQVFSLIDGQICADATAGLFTKCIISSDAD